MLLKVNVASITIVLVLFYKAQVAHVIFPCRLGLKPGVLTFLPKSSSVCWRMNSAEWTSFKPPLNQTKNTTENKTKHLLNKHFLYSFYTQRF